MIKANLRRTLSASALSTLINHLAQHLLNASPKAAIFTEVSPAHAQMVSDCVCSGRALSMSKESPGWGNTSGFSQGQCAWLALDTKQCKIKQRVFPTSLGILT